MTLNQLLKRILKVLAVMTISIILVIGIAIFAIWVDHKSETNLPVPKGKFAVGRAEYDWIDTTRIDEMAPQRGAKCELLAWIWYPAAVAKEPQIFAASLAKSI